MRYAIDPYFDERQKADVRVAASAWFTETDNRVCFLEEAWTPQPDPTVPGDVTVRVNRAAYQEDLGLFAGDLLWENHLGLFRHKEHDIWVVTANFSDKKISGITTHELGHALGLNHTIDTRIPSVMHPNIDVYSENPPYVYVRDFEEVCRLRGPCRCLP